MSSINRATNTPCLPQPVWQLGAHIPQLDGVRGLAILIVTLYRFSKEMPTDSWIGQTLHMTFMLGDRGVDLFFVLSGFLITGILVDAKGNTNYLSSFLARRSLRIFPLYFSALFLFLIATNWLPPYRHIFADAHNNQLFLWTYLTNVKMSVDNAWCFGYLDHFWSLAVEEHFYLVWPFVLLLCSRGFALRLACIVAAVSGGSRIAFATISDNGLAPDVLTIFRCDALLIGSIVALQIRNPGGLQSIKKWTYLVAPMCLGLGLGFAILDKRVFTLGHSLWPIFWACILIWLLTASTHQWSARFFDLAPLRKLGKYSYAMYVFQSPLIPITAAVLSVPIMVELLGNRSVSASPRRKPSGYANFNKSALRMLGKNICIKAAVLPSQLTLAARQSGCELPQNLKAFRPSSATSVVNAVAVAAAPLESSVGSCSPTISLSTFFVNCSDSAAPSAIASIHVLDRTQICSEETT
jgi:peptidoglycan/LPS O-acetylase OafA/YrhL